MDRKKRILFLLMFPIYGGGSGSFTRNLARQLAKTGEFDVAVASPDTRKLQGVKTYPIKPAFKAVFESHPEWKRAKRYSKLTGYEFERQYTSFLRDIGRIVESFKPDVIHVNHAHFLTWIASFIKSTYGISFIVTVHGTDIFNATLDRRYLVLTRQAVERAEQIVAVSPHTRKWFLKVFGQKLKNRTRIISPGIDSSSYIKRISTKNVDQKYKLQGKKLVIFVGRLTKEKGLEYLIRAAKKIKGEVFIIGDGSYKEYLQNYTKLIEVKNVHFLGYFNKSNDNELREFYQRANVVVLPSVVDESLGLVILEAMASLTPVVASKKGGIPLVIKDEYNGLLVRARSADAITHAVNRILKDEEMAKKMSQNAQETITKKFDWQMIVPQYENVYKKAFDVTLRLQRDRAKAILGKDELERERRELKEKIDLK